MTSKTIFRSQVIFPRITKICAVVAGSIALLTLVGWMTGIRFLAGQWETYIPMAPSTALAFLLLSSALFCYTHLPASRLSRLFTLTATIIVFLLGLLVLVQFIAGIDFGVEQVLSSTNEFLGSMPVGRMSPITAVAFLLESTAFFILVIAERWRKAFTTAALLSAIATGFNTIVLIGYVYDAPLLYGGTIIPVALPTAIAFVFVGVGLFYMARPGVHALRDWDGASMRGILLSAFLPFILIFIVFQGWLDIKIQPLLSLNPALWQSLMALVAGVLILIITGWIALRTGNEIELAQKTLADSEESFRLLFENSGEAILLSRPDGTIYSANPEACRIFSRSEDEIKEIGEAGIIDPNDPRLQALLEERRRTGKFKGELNLLRKDGTIFPSEIFTKDFKDSRGNERTSIIFRDLTETRLAEERIQRQLDHLTALSTIDRVITTNFDLKLSVAEILTHAMIELRIDAADILIFDSNSQILEYGAKRGFRTKSERMAQVRLNESFAGRAILERQLIQIPNLKEETDNIFFTTLLMEEDFVSYYGVPLISKGQVKGVLEVFNRSLLEPDAEWIDFLKTLAGQTAIAIENATLFESLQRSGSELALAYDATIEGWSRALDLRDKETEGHTKRVTEMTLQLARAIGLSETELVQVRWGALLHDIGKMGVPDGILLKPGPLTDEEWVAMKKHPLFAYEMLSPIRYLRLALDIPYCHHEKWDGTGYPQGLKGNQIPLSARIFAVVDVWDALSADRPYRAAWTEEKVREHILSLSGTHFDPKVVDVFMQILP